MDERDRVDEIEAERKELERLMEGRISNRVGCARSE